MCLVSQGGGILSFSAWIAVWGALAECGDPGSGGARLSAAVGLGQGGGRQLHDSRVSGGGARTLPASGSAENPHSNVCDMVPFFRLRGKTLFLYCTPPISNGALTLDPAFVHGTKKVHLSCTKGRHDLAFVHENGSVLFHARRKRAFAHSHSRKRCHFWVPECGNSLHDVTGLCLCSLHTS